MTHWRHLCSLIERSPLRQGLSRRYPAGSSSGSTTRFLARSRMSCAEGTSVRPASEGASSQEATHSSTVSRSRSTMARWPGSERTISRFAAASLISLTMAAGSAALVLSDLTALRSGRADRYCANASKRWARTRESRLRRQRLSSASISHLCLSPAAQNPVINAPRT
jgi:hypothetical protein